MENVLAGQLKLVIETQHGGTSTFVQSVRVHKPLDSRAAWDGFVHVYDLKNHPSAKRAYAWSSPIEGSKQPRFFAVLHQGRVKNPTEAVKAAAEAVHKWGAQKAMR